MAEQKKKQPVFTKVEQLRPMANGLNLTVKVVNTKLIVQRGAQARQMRLAECLVGDETGMIIFTARNDQGSTFVFLYLDYLSFATFVFLYLDYLSFARIAVPIIILG